VNIKLRMESRAAAEIVIRSDLNGRILPNTTAPLQMRFADTPHQKKLKEQMVYTRRAPSSPYYGFDPAFGYMPSSPYYLNNYYGVQPYGNMIYAEYMPSSPYSPIYYAPSSPTYVYDYSPTGGSPVFTATDRFNTVSSTYNSSNEIAISNIISNDNMTKLAPTRIAI